MVVQERFWHGVVVFAALVALVVGSIGIVSQSARSFPAMAQVAVSELAGYPGGGEQDSHVESADEVARKVIDCVPVKSGSGPGYTVCCYYNPFFTICWIETGAPVLSAQLMPEHLDPSSPAMSNLQAFSNQPFTPRGRL